VADVEYWIQLENRAWDVAPNNIDRLTGRTMAQVPGGAMPVSKVITSPESGVVRTLLLLLAQALKAYGWGRLFAPNERPKPLALAAGNGGAALIGVVLPGRFDDAMRVAVVRHYRPCPAGVRTLCLSLVMLGLIDSAALAPLAFVGAVFPGAGMGVRAGLAVVAVAGVAAAALILACHAWLPARAPCASGSAAG
jgi:hypothetical protein